MGALTLNVWASALLYDPVEKHLVPAKVTEIEVDLEEEEEEENNVGTTVTVTSPEEDEKTKNLLIVANSNSNTKVSVATKSVPKSASSVALENYKNSPVQGRMRKISMPTPSAREMTGQMHSTPALHSVPEGRTRRRVPPKSPSSSSFNYISTPYHGKFKKSYFLICFLF